MNAGALRALEFDRIVEAVGRFALTPWGAARLARLQPQTDPSVVRAALAATSETVRLQADAPIELRAAADLDATLGSLAVDGRALEAPQLLALAAFLSSVDDTAGAIRRVKEAAILRAIADNAASFEHETADIRRKIDPSGDVVDDASPELRSLRDRLRKQRTRLRGTLESYLRGKDTSKYLQQQVVTDRNGRYVLVVRSEHRTAIPGIVHGSSGSGASLFLEPLSTVEINNDIVALEQQEQEEVRRILLALSDAFRRRAGELQRTVEAATELDVLQARARFSSMVDGVEPSIAADGRLELRAARHPLLIPAVRAHLGEAGAERHAFAREPQARSGEASPKLVAPDADANATSAGGRSPGAEPIPVDILLIPPVSVLVITGPNTGGKTVALKTTGLLTLMAQAGLLIPAAGGSQVSVLRSVFADIGDEQSIAESLSTFSGHIANIVAMDRALVAPALVLLDEAGAGTDPVEGGALAMAIIEHFRLRGAMVVATTHYDALKSYASTTDGVTPAGFGFDPHNFAPTYRLNYGTPGSSLALEIAHRLGLPGSILEKAHAQRGEREKQLADHLARIERDTQSLEHERRLLARERQAATDAASKLDLREQDLKSREETFRRRMDERVEERLREARREIDAIVERLRIRTETMAAQAERAGARLVPTGQSGGARAEARAAIDNIGERLRRSIGTQTEVGRPAAVNDQPSVPPSVGDRVIVGALRLEGTVQALFDREVEVDVRGKRLRAKVDDLRVLAPAASTTPRVRVNIELQPKTGSSTELNVVGCNVDEALTRAEKFIDDAAVGEHRTVRVIHGYGTGQLRRAIAGFLQSHPLVATFGSAPAEQGGGGVTVVELKE
jgi:DNA mismatch repair protein MutS2